MAEKLDDLFEEESSGGDSEDEKDVDETKHARLLDAIGALDGKKRHNAVIRQEAALEVSDFSIGPTSDKSKVGLQDLVGALPKTVAHGSLKKQVAGVQRKQQILDVPLSKPEHERIQRSVAYEVTSKEVSTWDDIVRRNRQADQMKFPLDQPQLKLHTGKEFVNRFKPHTPLEMEVAALLHGSQHVFSQEKMLTPAEENALKAMSLEEAKKRREELRKHRALLSYKEIKAHRQKKIKSKNFHRILRKEKLKEDQKEMEKMQRLDPEAYMQKLKQIEKNRIQERMSLKHRGGSKYMQKQMIFGKYDDNARQSVQEMIQKSKELTQKPKPESESDSSGDDDTDNEDSEDDNDDQAKSATRQTSKSYNPWMSDIPMKKATITKLQPVVNKDVNKAESSDEEHSKDNNAGRGSDDGGEINEKQGSSEDSDEESDGGDKIDKIFSNIDKSKKTRKERNTTEQPDEDKQVKSKRKRRRRKQKTQTESESGPGQKSDNEDDTRLISASLTRKRTLEDLDDDWTDDEDDLPAVSRKRSSTVLEKMKDASADVSSNKEEEVKVDPKKVFTLETRINRAGAPDLVTGDDSDDDDVNVAADDEQRMTIAQAFADDDVLADFEREKKSIEERDKPKDIDMSLPGWGEWGGTGLEISKRKKRRFTIKAPPAPPRRDRNLGNVIISEAKDNTISRHQVKKLPFPFLNVSQFEASICNPVGQMWNTQKAFKQLTRPKVVTKLGTIIDPINKEAILNKEKYSIEFDPDNKKLKGN